MRFTWVALSILMSALSVAAATPDANATSPAPCASDEGCTLTRSQALDPIAILPASAIGVELTRSLKETLRVRGDTASSDDNGPRDVAPPVLLTRLRAACRAELYFIPVLTRRLAGFFPSYATTCPPPAGI